MNPAACRFGFALAVLLALLVSGCGGGSKSDTGNSSETQLDPEIAKTIQQLGQFFLSRVQDGNAATAYDDQCSKRLKKKMSLDEFKKLVDTPAFRTGGRYTVMVTAAKADSGTGTFTVIAPDGTEVKGTLGFKKQKSENWKIDNFSIP